MSGGLADGWVGEAAQGEAVAAQRRAEANEVLAAQLGQAREQAGLGHDPGVVLVAHLVAGAVAPDDEGVAKGDPRPM